MDIESLDDVGGSEPDVYNLGDLPSKVRMTDYAEEKAKSIDDLVKMVHGDYFEWYGFTLGRRDEPDVIADVRLGSNDENRTGYTRMSAESIEQFRRQLPENAVINGWIHSHADLGQKKFSDIDMENHQRVLDYVASELSRTVEKREVIVDNLNVLTEGEYVDEDLEGSTVSVVTDEPVDDVTILEAIKGSFSYGVLVGAGGWNSQEIWYKYRSSLMGREHIERLPQEETDMEIVETEDEFTDAEYKALRESVRQNIEPETGFSSLNRARGVSALPSGNREDNNDRRSVEGELEDLAGSVRDTVSGLLGQEDDVAPENSSEANGENSEAGDPAEDEGSEGSEVEENEG